MSVGFVAADVDRVDAGEKFDNLVEDIKHLLYGFIVAELSEEVENTYAFKLGETTAEAVIDLAGDRATIDELLAINEGTLSGVYPTDAPAVSELDTLGSS